MKEIYKSDKKSGITKVHKNVLAKPLAKSQQVDTPAAPRTTVTTTPASAPVASEAPAPSLPAVSPLLSSQSTLPCFVSFYANKGKLFAEILQL